MKEIIGKLSVALKQPDKANILALQERLSPISKNNRIALYNKVDARKSAVLILIHPINQIPHFTLIQRPVYKGAHSGQISFPGGKMDPTDANLEETARRECLEEIGIDIASENILGELGPIYVPPSNFIIHPFMGYLEKELVFTPEAREVETILHFPLNMLNEKNIKSKKMKLVANYNSEVFYYDLNGYEVWGATATILAEFQVLLNLNS